MYIFFTKCILEKNCQKTPTVVIQQNPPQNSSSGTRGVASSLLEQESLRCRFCDVKFSSVQELEYHSSESHHKLTVIKRLCQPEPSRLQSRPEPALPKPEPTLKCRPPPEGVYMGRYKLCHRYRNSINVEKYIGMLHQRTLNLLNPKKDIVQLYRHRYTTNK